MAFQSQMKCPNCGGQLKLSYDKTMMVQCESCTSLFTVDEISQYINSIKYNRLDDDDGIYAKEKFDEALTTKNIGNLKDDALIKRMRLALVTENYNELHQYVEELKRREPDNYLVYEYSLLMKYHIFRLEELENVKETFWEDKNYVILYRIADQFKRGQLDEITNKAKEKRNLAVKQQEKKETKSNAKRKGAIFLAILPLIVTVISAIILFSNYKQAAFLGTFIGLTTGWVFFLIASIVISILAIKSCLSNSSATARNVFVTIVCFLSLFGTLMTILGAVQIEPNFNPGNQINITITSVSDDTSYSTYETTFFMEIKNDSKYNFEEFGTELEIYKESKLLGSYTAWFKNQFMANNSVNTYLTISSSYSNIYYASLNEMTIKYKIKYIAKKQDGTKYYFSCYEKVADKRA